MKLDVQLTGTEAVRRQLLRIGAQATQKALDKTVVEVEAYVMREAGQHTKTGALFASVDKRRIPGGWEVFHDLQRAPHAVFVHWGTGLHGPKGKKYKIEPKAGGTYKSYKDIDGKTVRKGIHAGGRARVALRWPSGGAFRFARLVMHPGIEGDPWMVRAAQRAPALFARHVQDQINRLSATGA